MTEPTVGDEIQATLKRLGRTVFWTCAGLAVTVVAVAVLTLHSNAQIKAIATSTNAALCTVRSGDEQQVDDSRRFLIAHPSGIPGVPAATIQQSIVNQQRIIDALGGLDC